MNRSSRAKRVTISVSRFGEVRLTFPARGRNSSVDFALSFLEERVDWVLQQKRRICNRDVVVRSQADIEALRVRAKEYLPRRLSELAGEFGFVYGRVSVRIARTKWGSCTSNNDISLSLFLMTLPPHLIDFVLIHELCHTVHHNHSAEFHSLVDRCVNGREKLLSKELRHFSPQ